MTLKKSKKNVFLLGLSSLFNDLGSEMIAPLIPLYISLLGGGGIAIGLVSGLREGLSSVFKILGGWISDLKGKRKMFVFWGYLISTLFKFMLFFANSWQILITFFSLERFGKLRDAPRDAIIAYSKKERGRNFGLHQMFDASGKIGGTIIVIILYLVFNSEFKTMFLIAGALASLSLIPLFFVYEPKIKSASFSLWQGIHELNRKLKYFIFVSCIFTLANFGLSMFMIVRAKEVTGSTLMALILYTIFHIIFALLVIYAGKWADHVGKKKVLLWGYFLFFIVSVIFIYAQELVLLTLAFLIYGLVYATTQANQKALVADLSGEHKGTALGAYHAFTGLVNIPAGLIAGILWDISYQIMFIYLAVIAVISIVLLMFVREK